MLKFPRSTLALLRSSPLSLLPCFVLCLAGGLSLIAGAQTTQAAAQETVSPAQGKAAAARFLSRRGLLPGQRAAAAIVRARLQNALTGRMIAHSAGTNLGGAWLPVGPVQVTTAEFGAVTGRVSSIAVDPSDATGNTVYLGTTGGGVWQSTNAAGAASAVVFNPLTDGLAGILGSSEASLSIGAVTVQPGGTGVILAGTGDPNDAMDSYWGSGVLRSSTAA
jgi:hypothetical protein